MRPPARSVFDFGCRQLDDAQSRRHLFKLLDEYAVDIKIEARFDARAGNFMQVGFGLRAAKVAPGIEDVEFGAVALVVVLAQGDAAGIGPALQAQRGERAGQPKVMRLDALAAAAHALAALQLHAEASTTLAPFATF